MFYSCSFLSPCLSFNLEGFFILLCMFPYINNVAVVSTNFFFHLLNMMQRIFAKLIPNHLLPNGQWFCLPMMYYSWGETFWFLSFSLRFAFIGTEFYFPLFPFISFIQFFLFACSFTGSMKQLWWHACCLILIWRYFFCAL